MKADAIKFSDILKSLSVVPKFQRSYEWRKQQWEALWRTLSLAYFESKTKPGSIESRPTFLGAAVRLAASSDDLSLEASEIPTDSSVDVYTVIDGQQRIVTLTLFLAAVRDVYYSPVDEHGAYHRFSQDLLYFTSGYESAEYGAPRIRVQDVDLSAYLSCIARKSSRAELASILAQPSPIVHCYTFFCRKLLTPSEVHFMPPADEDSEEELSLPEVVDQMLGSANLSADLLESQHLTSIVKGLLFAVIDIPRSERAIAYDIFESLNARGLPLNNVDKFRNGYFMLSGSSADRIYEGFWAPIEAEHRGVDPKLETLDSFFFNEANRRFGWTPSDRVYGSMMDDLRVFGDAVHLAASEQQKELAQQRLEEQFESIMKASDAFLSISPTRRGKQPPIRLGALGEESARELEFLVVLEVEPLLPILMQLVLQTAVQPSPADLRRATSALESLIVRRLLVGIKPQQLRSMTSSWAPAIAYAAKAADASDGLAAMAHRLESLIISLDYNQYPSDDQILRNPDVEVFRSGKKHQLFFVLFELELMRNQDLASLPRPRYGTRKTEWNIEHVLPQHSVRTTPPSAPQHWMDYWSSNGVSEPEQEFFALRHTLGNLTPIRGQLNQQLRNDLFSSKRKEYVTRTNLVLLADIASEQHWLPETIRRRSDQLRTQAINRWPRLPQKN